MTSINFQFHATLDDFCSFIDGILNCKEFQACGVFTFPVFGIEEIQGTIFENDIKKYNFIVISRHDIVFADKYYEFMKKQDNNLIITIGTNENNSIKESSISVFSEFQIDPEWKKMIAKLKKNMLKGAWVINPNTNAKVYYKNHRYTFNAKVAYEKGVKIYPIGGWNIYKLTNEQNI